MGDEASKRLLSQLQSQLSNNEEFAAALRVGDGEDILVVFLKETRSALAKHRGRVLDEVRLKGDPPSSFIYLASVMLAPEDAGDQEDFADCATAKYIMRLLSSRGAPDNIDVQTATFLRIASRLRDINTLGARSAAAADRACNFVGWALLKSLRAATEGDRGSIAAAIREGAEVFREKETTLWAAWRSHGSAAHLWAAARIVGHDAFFRCAEDNAALRRLLCNAEGLRVRAIAWEPKGKKKPLLDPDRTWKVPDGLLS